MRYAHWERRVPPPKRQCTWIPKINLAVSAAVNAFRYMHVQIPPKRAIEVHLVNICLMDMKTLASCASKEDTRKTWMR